MPPRTQEQRVVAIYSRVSTDRQELENQLIDLRDYVRRCNWTIYKIYQEKISGKLESRIEFDALFSDARHKKFDLVLFWSLDRFSRAGVVHTIQKLNELNMLGVDYFSYQEPFLDSTGPLKEAVVAIFAALAKLEREKISEKTKAGIRRAKAEGKVVGRAPISKFQMQKIKELRSQGLSFGEISKRMHVSKTTVFKYCQSDDSLDVIEPVGIE